MQIETKFMIDIETTGVDIKRDEILEIGILELKFINGFWIPGKSFQTYVKSDRQPESEFAIKYMSEVYAAANKAETNDPATIRESILAFLNKCCRRGREVHFIGKNAMGFDLPFMHAAGFLKPPGYETINGKDVPVGDHHYRVYEMSGAISVTANAINVTETALRKAMSEAYPMDLPEGSAHTAIYDCYSQTRDLNGLIEILREGAIEGL